MCTPAVARGVGVGHGGHGAVQRAGAWGGHQGRTLGAPGDLLFAFVLCDAFSLFSVFYG